MARKHYHLKFGTLGTGGLPSASTTIDFGSDPGFGTLADGDVVALTLGDFAAKDPAALETVHVTAFTAGDTTATVARAQEGTSELEHASGTEWRHVATSEDLKRADAGAAEVSGDNFSLLKYHRISDGVGDQGLPAYDMVVSRAAAAKLVVNEADWMNNQSVDISVMPDPGTDQFTDLDPDGILNTWINRGGAAGIFGPTGVAFEPASDLSRAVFARWLWAALDFVGEAPALDTTSAYWVDVPQTHADAEYIYAIAGEGWLGDPVSDTFGPDDTMVRGEVLTSLARIIRPRASGRPGPEVMVVVQHGDDVAFPRPTNALAVYWIGSVEPTNALTSDMWHNTSA